MLLVFELIKVRGVDTRPGRMLPYQIKLILFEELMPDVFETQPEIAISVISDFLIHEILESVNLGDVNCAA